MKLSKKKILIIDYGMGNISSVQSALIALGYRVTISNQSEEFKKADAFILPGVGAFGLAMENIRSIGIEAALKREVIEKTKPILGICLGMQLLAERSSEMGDYRGLGFIPGHVEEINSQNNTIRVPHVGWNEVIYSNPSELFINIPSKTHFYFDHSFHFVTESKFSIANVEYGSSFLAAIRNQHIFGAQFHPEKSQNSGLRVLRNYLNFVEEWGRA
jgi:glutamine amidotransferase